MKKKFNIANILVIVFYLILGIACGKVIAEYMAAEGLFDLPFHLFMIRLLLFLPVVYASMFLQIAIHEGGHLIFGLASGYKFTSFRVANLMWIRENGKIRLKKFSLAGTGGQCLLEPPDMVDGKIPYKLYNLGGVLLNLISAVILLAIACFVEMPLIDMILKFMAFSGIIFAFTNGIPFSSGVDNDGKNLQNIGRSTAAMHAFWLQMKSNSLLSQGFRIKDMPAEWFEEISPKDMNDSIKAFVGVLTCNRYMDMCDFENANRLMSSYLADDVEFTGAYRSMLICDKIYCDLVSSDSLDDSGSIRPEVLTSIEKLLDKNQKQFMKAMKNQPSIIRTEYTIALLMENNEAKASPLKLHLQKIGRSYPYAVELEAEEEFINIALKAYQKKQSI